MFSHCLFMINLFKVFKFFCNFLSPISIKTYFPHKNQRGQVEFLKSISVDFQISKKNVYFFRMLPLPVKLSFSKQNQSQGANQTKDGQNHIKNQVIAEIINCNYVDSWVVMNYQERNGLKKYWDSSRVEYEQSA